MKDFSLIGAAGYVAPRHMRAIRDTGNRLVAALDISDSVGVIDSYFPDAHFFTEFERFDRHIDLLRRKKRAVNFVSICSPNYLHDAHVRFGLRSHAHVICEKPIVLNPWNLDGLIEMERETGKRIFTILQLRLHPAILALKEQVATADQRTKHDVDLVYITSRGRWYNISWKGDAKKSGGIATNIGIHFFDMLGFVFGPMSEQKLHYRSASTAAGFVELERARVRWILSIDRGNLPSELRGEGGQQTYRRISVDGREIEFSGGFTDLHTKSYERILAGNGFPIEENRAAVTMTAEIRDMTPIGLTGDYHPYLASIVG
ncbi:MAG: Gfo/Idh/MocA family oxidoreductase [Gammaproteobacteria bacterium]|nr:Gfo/Idh/MocA family oxidoreductase [Gammaproteobacteria bacterium]